MQILLRRRRGGVMVAMSIYVRFAKDGMSAVFHGVTGAIKMRTINQIIIHCSDTPAGMDIGAKEIRQWHTAPPPKGNGWADIGYHYVIRRNGIIESGRPEATVGAHVAGHNANSLGICLVGGGHGICNFTRLQWRALDSKILELCQRYSEAAVCGHRDLNPEKACPAFDARAWWNFEGGKA